MTKRLNIFLLLLLCNILYCNIIANAASKDDPSIVVLPFQINGSSNDEELQTELPMLLATALKNKGFRVIPNKSALNLLYKQNISQLNISTAKKVAQQLHADYVVYGSFNQTGENFSIDSRLIDSTGVASARPLYIEKPKFNELNIAVTELAERISNGLIKKNTIADVRIHGLKVLDPDVILTRLTINKGDHTDHAKINAEIKKIWELGYFSDVSASIEESGEGRLLVFTVQEKPKITDVVVQGSKAVSIDNILAAMSSKKGSVISDRLLSQDIQKITDLYRKEGYYLAEVNYEIKEKENTSSATLLLTVNEGKKLYIKDVRIEGLETIKAKTLKKELALTERNFLSWFTGTGVLREEYLERDSIAISAYAMNHGYVDIQVASPEVTFNEKGIVITFRVKEGKRYKIGKIDFKGDLIETNEQLLKVTKIDDHKNYEQYFSLSVMQDDVKALTDFYSDYGYAFAEVDLETTKNEEDATIDVTFLIDKKQKVFLRRIIVEGNTRTRDNVILRELRLADGDLFNGQHLRRSNERLNRLGYFNQVDTDTLPTGKDDEVDLLVKVQEARTGAITGGVGYSTHSKFGVSGSISERNLWGKGYILSIEGFISSKSSSLDLSFTNPRVYDTDFGFSNNIYTLRDEWDDFRKKTYGDTIRLFHPIGEYSSIFVGYRIDQYRLYDIPSTAPRSYLDYQGKNISSVVSGGFTFDSTDSHERPSKGHIAKLIVEYGGGGLGGNDNFFKPIAELQGFYSISRSKNHIIHWRTRAGAAYKNSKKPVPVFDRFFIGGIDSIRGYDTEDLAPKDPRFGDEIGGDRMAFLNLEYIWTFQPELGLALVPFYDIGFQTDSVQTSNPFSKLKQSYGLELRWRSPMGDLRFAYGIPLNKNVSGKKTRGRFEFSMGQFF
ncbi:outer membrane protein assembly factor BamA [Lawsonia intracellularis]|uniref:outer membrane protein assembly factor BamA n=1 Tax=Lawsonia intracellularis TaxID=29546 RepID=UPI0021E5CCFD|nr:outer membrane protein assembly factor BamA [Lawsonia intracellularis]UYH52766.1 outer membrane protein assembly factor BamA [Lawsonia intracellularis]